ncbi:phospholipase A2 [Planobispora rosea]|uniref:phospholipase A2 n=1 Tax=Planobispora rosea TaxID=35762 RepID=UPI00083AEAFB|nr:phospholipase A2 [Planobispora rosea]
MSHGQTWRWRARGYDGFDYGPWSAYRSYTVDAELPAAPSITCPDYPADAWTPGTGTEVTCTLDTTSADGAGYYWSLDSDDLATLAADPNGTGGDALTITINPADGQHVLYAKARDVALQTSPVTTYSFGVGTDPAPVLELSALAGEPGEQIIVSIPNVPAEVMSAMVTSPAFDGGGIELTRGAAEEPLSAAVTIMNGIKPGVYDVNAVFDAQPEPLTIQLDVNGPGRIDGASGAFIVSATDASYDGLLITRSHSASSTGQSHQNILGPGWRAEILGGMIDSRLERSQENPSSFQLTATDGEAKRYVLDANDPAGITYIAEDGSTLVEQSPERYIEHRETGIEIEWTYRNLGASSRWLATALGNADSGMTTVSYDERGRVVRLDGPGEAAPTTAICPGPDCASVTLTYATTTTAAADTLGDQEDQLQAISYTPGGDVQPQTLQRYRYDASGRLRLVESVEDATQTTYVYNDNGDLTQLTTNTAEWTFTYDIDGTLVKQEKAEESSDTATATIEPASFTTARASAKDKCTYMEQFLWGDGKTTCWISPVPMEYGGKGYYPKWMRTPGSKKVSKAVVGVVYDHCTGIWDKPEGFDYRIACNMHDYGYGIIYKYKGTGDTWTKKHRSQVDDIFYTTMRDYICNSYTYKQACKDRAYDYYLGVRNLGGWTM